MAELLKIDWHNASYGDRAILYTFTKPMLDERGWTVPEFLKAVVTPPFIAPKTYVDNFRAGKISRSKAAQIANWIEKNDPERARQMVEAIFRARAEASEAEPSGTWEAFLKSNGVFEGVSIIPLEHQRLGLTRIADREPVADRPIKPGEHFCFRINSPIGGSLIAFQQYLSLWYRLDLTESETFLNVAAGLQHVPFDPATGEIVALSEEEHFEKHKYVFVISDAQTVEQIATITASHGAIPEAAMNELATVLSASDKGARSILQINVLFAKPG